MPMPNRSRKPRQSRAFTLVEAMVATTVLSVSLLAVFGAFSVGQRATIRAQRLDHAVALSEAKLADLMARGYMPLGTSEGDFSDRYRWKCTIMPDLQAMLVRITIDVIWDERGTARAHRLVTLAASPQALAGTSGT